MHTYRYYLISNIMNNNCIYYAKNNNRYKLFLKLIALVFRPNQITYVQRNRFRKRYDCTKMCSYKQQPIRIIVQRIGYVKKHSISITNRFKYNI